ncbi:MAG: hypothetical protein ACYCSG_05065 [Thermoplasmataceae archaeon]
MRNIRFARILATILIVFGIIINFVPMGSYYFTTYNNSLYKGTIVTGSCWNYNGTFGTFALNESKGTTFYYGIDLTVTKSTNNNYEISEKIFNLSSHVGIVISGFSGGTVTSVQKYTIECHSTGLIPSILFPNSRTITNKYFSERLCNNSYSPGTEPFVGIPYEHLTNQTNSGFLSLYIESNGNYLLNQFTGTGDPLLGSDSLLSLFSNFYPSVPKLNVTNAGFFLTLTGGNTVPSQRWVTWLEDGFYGAYPVNLAVLLAGIILSVIGLRRPRR